MGGPFLAGDGLGLSVPDGGDVGVGEEEEFAVGFAVWDEPDGFGDIDDDVAVGVFGVEDGDFCIAAGADGAIEEADAWVSATGVGEGGVAVVVNEQRSRLLGCEVELFDVLLDL